MESSHQDALHTQKWQTQGSSWWWFKFFSCHLVHSTPIILSASCWGLGTADSILSWLLPRSASIPILTAPFPLIPCCLEILTPYPLPTVLLLSDSTCQPLLCNGAQQERPHTWRLSKARHRLGVVGRDCGKQTATDGFCGWLFPLHVSAECTCTVGWVHWRLLLPGRSEWRLRKSEVRVQAKPIAALLPTTVPILVPYASPLRCRGTNEQKQSSRDSHYTPVLPFASGSPLPLLHPWEAHLPVHSLHFGVSSSWCLGLGCLVCVFLEWPELSPLGAVNQMWLSLQSVS